MTYEIPCKIGDTVWAICNIFGTMKIQKGVVSELFFIEGMKLCIVVRKVARGEWGKVVFPSLEEAQKAISEMYEGN